MQRCFKKQVTYSMPCIVFINAFPTPIIICTTLIFEMQLAFHMILNNFVLSIELFGQLETIVILH